jgi:phosphate transport system substrate-binding protein
MTLVWLCGWAMLIGCGCVNRVSNGPAGSNASGGSPITITVDGSSSVYPIAQAVAEAYKARHPNVEIAVGFAGTSGGFKRFLLGEIDICNASRPIRESEQQTCAEKGIEYLELQVAVDGLSLVVNKDNDWVDCLSMAQLKQIWEPDSKVKKWSDLDSRWPDAKIELFGADADSGTFDYFTEVVNGKSRVSRTDYTPSANDNVLVRGVASEKYSLGYFPFGYFVENQERLKALAIKASDDADCVAPTIESIEAEQYRPMSRPMFMYVNKKSLARPEVAELLSYALSEEGQQKVVEAKSIRLKADVRQQMQEQLAAARGGAAN